MFRQVRQRQPNVKKESAKDWIMTPMSRTYVDQAAARYSAQFRDTVARTHTFIDDITEIVEDAGINYLSVTGRAKSPASFATKVARRLEELGPSFDAHYDVTDQVGVRIITYVHSDIAPVAQLLADHFTVLEDRDMGVETASQGQFGYSSRHMLISRDPSATHYDPTTCASVQLRTVLQHAWAEFEHDARYKGEVPAEHAAELDRRFTLAAGLLELADREFSTIRDTLQSSPTDATFRPHGVRIEPTELASFLAGRYADSGYSRSDHYVEAVSLLTALGLTSIEDLRRVLADVDAAHTARAMGYRRSPGAVRRLEDDLIVRYREEFVDLPANESRRETLRGRMQRLGGATATN